MGGTHGTQRAVEVAVWGSLVVVVEVVGAVVVVVVVEVVVEVVELVEVVGRVVVLLLRTALMRASQTRRNCNIVPIFRSFFLLLVEVIMAYSSVAQVQLVFVVAL